MQAPHINWRAGSSTSCALSSSSRTSGYWIWKRSWQRAAGKLSKQKLDALADAIPEVLGEAIAAGGSTLKDFAQPDGELGYFSKTFDVYGREGMPCACSGSVKRIVQSGRSTFFCPACQR